MRYLRWGGGCFSDGNSQPPPHSKYPCLRSFEIQGNMNRTYGSASQSGTSRYLKWGVGMFSLREWYLKWGVGMVQLRGWYLRWGSAVFSDGNPQPPPHSKYQNPASNTLVFFHQPRYLKWGVGTLACDLDSGSPEGYRKFSLCQGEPAPHPKYRPISSDNGVDPVLQVPSAPPIQTRGDVTSLRMAKWTQASVFRLG